jgi:HSP20 family protein
VAEKRQGENRTPQPQGQRELQRPAEQNRVQAARRDPFDAAWSGPFALMRRMQEDMDRLFGGFGGSRWSTPFGGTERLDWAPAIDAFQRANEFVVRADVPGLSRDDLTVEIADDSLTIRGERTYDHQEEREGVFSSERAYGSFCRVVPLPEGAMADNAKANFRDGVLEIVVPSPPQEVRRGRRLEIAQDQSQRSEQKQST